MSERYARDKWERFDRIEPFVIAALVVVSLVALILNPKATCSVRIRIDDSSTTTTTSRPNG